MFGERHLSLKENFLKKFSFIRLKVMTIYSFQSYNCDSETWVGEEGRNGTGMASAKKEKPSFNIIIIIVVTVRYNKSGAILTFTLRKRVTCLAINYSLRRL